LLLSTCSLELSVIVVAFGASLSLLVADVYSDIHWRESSLLVVLRSAVLGHRNLRKLRQKKISVRSRGIESRKTEQALFFAVVTNLAQFSRLTESQKQIVKAKFYK